MDIRQLSLIIKNDMGRSSTSMLISARPIILLLITFVSLSLVQTARGQGMSPASQSGARDGAPPPLKLLSKNERSALEADSQPKSRTALTLTMMEERLTSAEKSHSSEDYFGMYQELGGFQALLDNQLDFLLRNSSTSNKSIVSLKKFEFSLHTFAPRIELLRREVPSEYEPYLLSLLKYLNEAREKALEPLFGDAGQPR